MKDLNNLIGQYQQKIEKRIQNNYNIPGIDTEFERNKYKNVGKNDYYDDKEAQRLELNDK